MAEHLETREKKCPKCGSLRVDYIGSSGAGTVTQSGKDTAQMVSHQYRCSDCEAHFVYKGPR